MHSTKHVRDCGIPTKKPQGSLHRPLLSAMGTQSHTTITGSIGKSVDTSFHRGMDLFNKTPSGLLEWACIELKRTLFSYGSCTMRTTAESRQPQFACRPDVGTTTRQGWMPSRRRPLSESRLYASRRVISARELWRTPDTHSLNPVVLVSDELV